VALAECDGSVAGVVLCERWDDEGHGFVAYLATARAWRRRGLGLALLTHAFWAMRAAGLSRATLSVNGRNRSAMKLYESVGMQVEWHAERYEKRLSA
jgi:ribosomal protein S18 acetylase RimI-like enzyme